MTFSPVKLPDLTENLFPGNSHVVGNTVEDGRLDEVTASAIPSRRRQQISPIVHFQQSFAHAFESLDVVNRCQSSRRAGIGQTETFAALTHAGQRILRHSAYLIPLVCAIYCLK